MTRMEYRFTGHIEDWNYMDKEHNYECPAVTPDREIAFEINVADDIADELIKWQNAFNEDIAVDIPDFIFTMLAKVYAIAEHMMMLEEGYDGMPTKKLWAHVGGKMHGNLRIINRPDANITANVNAAMA